MPALNELSSSDKSEVPTSVSPNSVPDQPTHVDTLGFKPYVEAVAVFLTHADTKPPLTLSVEGAWGSGKSSFMLQLEDRIKEIGGKTVSFNAWLHDKDEELWAAFALEFTNDLSKDLPFWKRWMLHLELSWRRFSWQQGWFQLAKFTVLAAFFLYISASVITYARRTDSPLHQFLSPAPQQGGEKSESKPKPEEVLFTLLLKGGWLSGYLFLGFILIRKIAEVIGNPLEVRLTNYIRDPKYETRATFVETFHSDFKRLVRTYAQGRRVYVFIDDLDRCEVPKAAELMQALNLMMAADTPSDDSPEQTQVFYILGLDREKIAAGLAAKYEKLLPYLCTQPSGQNALATTGTEFGYNYLEKFIQLPFLVPQPAEQDIEKLLDSLSPIKHSETARSGTSVEVDPGLLVRLSTDSTQVREVVKMVAPSLDYNPRRLKQFVNLFRLRALLASQTGLFGSPREGFTPFTLEQLGKLIAIILRWPLLLVDVEARPNLLTSIQDKAWGTTAAGKPTQSTPVLDFWTSKRNLMELVSFSPRRPPTPEDKQRYGLHGLDIDRFLQVSPLVKGRENIGASASEVAEHANIRNIPSPSDDSHFGEFAYESAGTGGPVQSREPEVFHGETASNSGSSSIPESPHFEESSPEFADPNLKAKGGWKAEAANQRVTARKKRSDFDTPA